MSSKAAPQRSRLTPGVLIALVIFAIAFLIFRHVDVSRHIPSLKKSSVNINAISGLPGENGPVLVVKIDDTSYAHPQVGLSEADLVYIEQVEGGLTRLAAVFSRSIPERIGPVRSARITDIDLLSQYGFIAFAYSGAQQKLRPVLAAANWKDVGAEKLGRQYYANAEDRTPPYAMMLNAQTLMSKLEAESEPIARAKTMGWKFGEAPDSGTAITKVDVTWPAARYTVRWSKAEGRWLLFHNGRPNVDDNNVQLGASTFVIQNVRITPSEYRDKVGGVTPLSEVIGSGSGFILRDGKSFPAQWSRASADQGTMWRDLNGNEMFFAPGQIWVALTDQPPRFTPESKSQPSSPRP